MQGLRRLLGAAAAAALTGCGTLADINQRAVDRAEPTVVHDLKGRAWIWLQGVVPLMRAKELDKRPPAEAAEKPAS